jgi:hypothetical protein
MSYSDESIHEALLRMKSGDMSMRRHDNRMAGSLIRRRVRLVSMETLGGDRLEPGDEGTVYSVFSNGTVNVRWDRPVGVGVIEELVPGRDRWEWGAPPPTMIYPDDETINEALLRFKKNDMSMRELDKELFKDLAGRRLRLVFTNDEYTHLEPGDEGFVYSVDDSGTLRVNWDQGEGLGLIPGSDRWEWL